MRAVDADTVYADTGQNLQFIKNKKRALCEFDMVGISQRDCRTSCEKQFCGLKRVVAEKTHEENG